MGKSGMRNRHKGAGDGKTIRQHRNFEKGGQKKMDQSPDKNQVGGTDTNQGKPTNGTGG